MIDYIKKKIAWIAEQFRYNIEELQGIPVRVEHGDARREICNKCENRVNGFFSDKCGLCSCPLSVKPYFLNHILAAVNITVDRDEENRTRVICPHKDGNKWQQIDDIFLIKEK